MSLTRNTVIAAAAGFAALLMTGSSFASTFEAIYTVSIHSHATKHSAIVDKLYEGEHVKINSCDDDWCLIAHDGPDGWVPVASLERIGASYDGGDTTIVFEGGIGYPHPKKPPVIVDPGPKKPPFGGPVIGQLPVGGLLPISGGGGSGGNGGSGGSGAGGSGNNSNICLINPQLCANHKPL